MWLAKCRGFSGQTRVDITRAEFKHRVWGGEAKPGVIGLRRAEQLSRKENNDPLGVAFRNKVMEILCSILRSTEGGELWGNEFEEQPNENSLSTEWSLLSVIPCGSQEAFKTYLSCHLQDLNKRYEAILGKLRQFNIKDFALPGHC